MDSQTQTVDKGRQRTIVNLGGRILTFILNLNEIETPLSISN
jgi:hypothetical protein